MTSMNTRQAWFCVLLASFAGCSSRPARVLPPDVDPAAAAASAVALCDANGDGAITKEEANKAPSIREGWRGLDSNKDNLVTADEIESRIAAWVKSKVGVTSVACAVMLNGQPLANADVVLEPEPFLDGEVKPATGRTDGQGQTFLQISRELPGVQCGFYRVKISKKVGDQESIPQQFNEATTLGLEVWLRNDWPGSIATFNLTGK